MTDLFKKPKKKLQIRKKLDAEQEDENQDAESTRVADIRDLQKSRERKNGLTELECAVGIQKAAALEDGIQMTTSGGMVMTSKKKAAMEAASIEQGLREQFEKETMLRDEHEELRKYIDEGLKDAKRNNVEPSTTTTKFSSMTAEERDIALLRQAAEKVKANREKTETELLSEHMLAGIPEVDLGISARITNILETEKKKRFLLEKAAAIAAGLPPPVEESDEPTEFFSQNQIDEIRECFNLYCAEGVIISAAQLRCVLRSLGYSPTSAKTMEYFKRHNRKPIEFSTFLEIAKEEQNSGDSLTEIIKALRGLDRDGSKAMPSRELRAILSSVGERLTKQEIDYLLSQVEVNGMVPHQKLIQYISR
ncbi:unnamed protein product [Caenorhabditis bovis]|uniref:EF-hand domain-containing protein n=1 Tax=Caenorhabditis bovis TaxID=2654633 RepID=A0A8S1F736_9PELO|nr:unnamed protein product [Caenorhabditis bovis]